MKLFGLQSDVSTSSYLLEEIAPSAVEPDFSKEEGGKLLPVGDCRRGLSYDGAESTEVRKVTWQSGSQASVICGVVFALLPIGTC